MEWDLILVHSSTISCTNLCDSNSNLDMIAFFKNKGGCYKQQHLAVKDALNTNASHAPSSDLNRLTSSRTRYFFCIDLANSKLVLVNIIQLRLLNYGQCWCLQSNFATYLLLVGLISNN